MHEHQDVVGVRRCHRLEGCAVGDRRVGRAPRVHRVPDVAHRREVLEDARTGALGQRWQVDPGPRREIRHERCFAGAHGDDSRPPTADRSARSAESFHELRGLEQLVEVGAPDHARGVEGRIGHARLAGQRAGMRDRRRLRLVAPADLHHHDGLAQLERPIGEGEEAFRALETLEEEDDRRRFRVVQAVRQVIADVEDDLRPAADDPGEPDPRSRMDEGVGDGPGLGDAGNAAARQVRRDVADVRGGIDREVHHPHAVGADQGEPVLPGDVRDLSLHRCGCFAALDDAAAGDDHRRDTGRGGVPCHHRGPQRVQRHERDVRAFGKRVERRVAGLPVELFVARVDEVAARRAAGRAEIVADRLRDPAARRCPDHRDRARGEQRPQVDRAGCGRHVGHVGHVAPHPTTRSTPRFSSARAMIRRWISDVPSQIRSTRSSRKNRSAGNSRM